MKINIETTDDKADKDKESASQTETKPVDKEDSPSADVQNDTQIPVDENTASRDSDLEAKNKEYLDHLQRLQAEFENYKRRTNKEKSETIKYANSRLAERLLAVVDNLQRGLKLSAGNEAAADIVNGMRLVERQLADILSEFGVTTFEVLGQKFDPNIHEPVYTVERDNVEADVVVEEIEKGYMIHDKLLRAAKVAVSRDPSPKEA